MSRVRRQNQNPYAETRKVDSEESNLIVHRCGRVVEEQGSGTALSSVSPRWPISLTPEGVCWRQAWQRLAFSESITINAIIIRYRLNQLIIDYKRANPRPHTLFSNFG